MGEDVDSRNFTRQDRQQYRAKVRRCLDVFARMLAEAKFDLAVSSDRRNTGGVRELRWVAVFVA